MATKYYFNILKTEAAQTFFFTAQTGTNGAQTNKTILREFGACGGAGDVIAYISMSNILKTEAAQTKILTAQTKHKRLSLFWVNLEHVGGLSHLRMTYKYNFNI